MSCKTAERVYNVEKIGDNFLAAIFAGQARASLKAKAEKKVGVEALNEIAEAWAADLANGQGLTVADCLLDLRKVMAEAE